MSTLELLHNISQLITISLIKYTCKTFQPQINTLIITSINKIIIFLYIHFPLSIYLYYNNSFKI